MHPAYLPDNELVARIRAQVRQEMREANAERSRRGWETRRRNEARRAAAIADMNWLAPWKELFFDFRPSRSTEE
ncbi:MAG TPA: hypothetical protein VGF59_15310 [Bryobacteraceae bacterium]|jgi:hypothetical protein